MKLRCLSEMIEYGTAAGSQDDGMGHERKGRVARSPEDGEESG